VVAKNETLELEMEVLARAKRVVLHRSPGQNSCSNRCGYFVCDCNNNVLFPLERFVKPRGATVEDTHKWLSADRHATYLLAS
jgi:hypothetical protein